MARILYAWELGWRLSHLSNLVMVHESLRDQDHTFGLAARELWNVHDAFSGTPVQYYQAPFKQGPTPLLPAHECHAHMLFSSGYANPQELTVLISAWIGVLGSFRPDVLILDHSPTALLASRCLPVHRILVGSGFLVPGSGEPMGLLPDASRDPKELTRMMQDEDKVRDNINNSLQAFGLAPLQTLQDMYEPVEEKILLTYEELDPFQRTRAEYSGVWPVMDFENRGWDGDTGPRIFAYLDNFPGLERLLEDMKAPGGQVLVYGPGIPSAIQEAHAGGGLSFLPEPIDLEHVAADCDVFVSHGAHTSVARFLLQGVPQLMIPNYKEQLYTAVEVARVGAGVLASREDASHAPSLRQVLEEPSFREAAEAFAAKHRHEDPAAIRGRLLERVDARLASGAAPTFLA